LDRTDPTGLYECSGGKSDCAAIDKFVSGISAARSNLDPKSDAYKRVDAVVGALGKAGEKNGIVLTATSLKGKALAAAGPNGSISIDVGKVGRVSSAMFAAANPGVAGQDVRNGIGAGAVAHETRHELDFLRIGFPTSKAAEFRTELNAYKAESGVHQGLGLRTGLSSPEMTDEQRDAAVMRGAQASTDAWCAAGGPC
jgi:hypothetical protein